MSRRKRHDARLPRLTNPPGFSRCEGQRGGLDRSLACVARDKNAAHLSVDDVSRQNQRINQAVTDCLRRARIVAPNPPKPASIMAHVAGSGTAEVTVWAVAKKIELVPAKA